LVNTKWDEIESDDEDEPVEMCLTSTTSTDHQASNPEKEEDQRSEHCPSAGTV
jgi:hypothetical protein